MENLEILILTTVITTLFAVFIGLTFRELKESEKKPRQGRKSFGPITRLVNLVSIIFEDDNFSKEEKKKIYKAMYRTIADMESDGIRFSDEVIKELRKAKEESD